MKIIKVINNNVVSALDKDAEEVVIMGKGIGFHAEVSRAVRQAGGEASGGISQVIRPDYHLC